MIMSAQVALYEDEKDLSCKKQNLQFSRNWSFNEKKNNNTNSAVWKLSSGFKTWK